MIFGTKEYMTDVRCPAINVIRNREKWTTSGTYLNGGGFARGSAYSHAVYTIAWNLMSPDEARKILDFYNGNYGQGVIYFLDDFALEGNILPLHWSVPRLTVKDAPPLVRGVVISETSLAAVNNAGAYPSASATFSWSGVPNSDSVWIPVPPGQNFYFGVRGSRTGTAEVTLARDKVTPGVLTNLLTNPSMEATSGTVEVRRNRALAPMPTTDLWAADWGTGGAGTRQFFASGGPDGVAFVEQKWTAAATGNTRLRLTVAGTGGIPVTPGETIPLSVDAAGSKALAFTWDWYNGATYLSSGSGPRPDVSPSIATPTRLTATTGTAPATATHVYVFAHMNTPVAGDFIRATRFLAGEAGEFFAPGLPSPDSDLTASWTGAANASPSVLTGVGVTGVSAAQPERAVRFSSTQWAASGTRSIRVSPRQTTGTHRESYAAIAVSGLTVGNTYTVLGTVRLAAPQTGTLSADAFAPPRGFWVTSVAGSGVPTYISTAPNVAGAHEVRATFVTNATLADIRLMNGALPGGGDVWWDNLALVEGEYTGPYFDGNTPDTADWDYAWTGAANASTSRRTGASYYGTGNPMPTTTTQRTNTVLTDPGGVTISIGGSGSLTLNSMYGYIGTEPPPNGNFRSGEGHTGVVFDGVPQRTGYSAAIGDGLESVSSSFKEVGAWR